VSFVNLQQAFSHSRNFRSLLSGVLLLVIGALSGCGTSPSGGVQVVDRGNGRSGAERQPVSSGQYAVQRGDTLYSIAFRFGWDWKALAQRNNIPAPYTIRPGQVIRFGEQGKSVASRAPVAQNNPAVVVKTVPVTPTVSVPSPTTVTPSTQVTPVPSPAITSVVTTGASSKGWSWPASGLLIGKFSSNGSLNKGIDIAGNLGQPVLAASDGTVVYAGSGLRGYGELVIIKHSDTYVSAYGHNQKLLVQEGQQVKAGQKIAEMGSTGTDRVKLHFEIRRQGKPVDPLQYLPRR
jgi:lipoprotein NlpD